MIHMEMGKKHTRMIELKVHSSRGQLLKVHSNLSIELGLVDSIHMIELIH